MEEKNFRSFMTFLELLENEDLKGSTVEAAMAKLASTAELTEEQRQELAALALKAKK